MGKLIHREFYKKLKFRYSNKGYGHKTVVRNNEIKNSLRFWDKNESFNPGQKTRSKFDLREEK